MMISTISSEENRLCSFNGLMEEKITVRRYLRTNRKIPIIPQRELLKIKAKIRKSSNQTKQKETISGSSEIKKERNDDKDSESKTSAKQDSANQETKFRSSAEWETLLGSPAWKNTHDLIRQVRGSIERQNENLADMTSNLAQLKSDVARDEKERKEDEARRKIHEERLKEALLDLEDRSQQIDIKLTCLMDEIKEREAVSRMQERGE
jgi:hypothetical protein